MKTLVFIKTHPIIQIGHMYEHLFAAAVVKELREHKLYEFIDYYLTGHTFHSGIIEIEIEIYSGEVEKVLLNINDIVPDFSDDSILGVWNAIEAEERTLLSFTTDEAIQEALRELDQQQWQRLDEIDFVKKPVVPEDQSPLYLAEGDYLPSDPLLVTFRFDAKKNKDKELFPVFDQLSWAMGFNAQYMITRDLGLYYFSMEGESKSSSMQTRIEFLTYPEFELDEKDVHDDIIDLIEEMKRTDAFDRLITLLISDDPAAYGSYRPTFERSHTRTDQPIGLKGWKRTATIENIKYLLDTMKIDIGRTNANT